ncbi:UNKNOWN [Stylonychia lemnae]|uniref:Uncharacterized protein n=1 Tax=Stylonychia lemnae TaxID=5949 RepID=A0A077ZV32_STYLE|nr:UNKNOWN [Stylonychia lemnae]|eukprot:CDW72291.1 UNKNOWN [Stylonychia lemnae]
MSSKTVFKIFASFGPAGSIVALTEKLCRRIFNEAYDLGDATFSSKEESEIKKIRQEFVNELFNLKGPFETKSQSLNPLVQLKAHSELYKLIEKYRRKITQLEKQKLHKEMQFFLGEENQLKYQQAKDRLETIEEDVDDNLKKMAFHVMEPDVEKFHEAAQSGQYEIESSIEERISQLQAEEIMESYKRQLVEAEAKFGNNQKVYEEQIEKIKDNLFVQFGEDVLDIFEAFNHYGLDTEITSDDRKKYPYSPNKKDN